MSGNLADKLPPDHTYLARRLEALERRIKELEAARTSEATAVGRGGVTIRGGAIRLEQSDGTLSAYFGRVILPGGTPSAGLILYRHNGNEFFVLTGDPTGQFWALRDEAFNIVMSDDAASGQGLATPYIPLTAIPTSSLLGAGGETTVSGTFGPLWTVHGHKQHPRLRVGLWVMTTDTTTTAEIRLRDANGGSVIDGPNAVAASNNAFVSYELVGPVPGGHLSSIKIEVDARRTAGAGTVHVVMAYAEGIQS